VDTKLRQLERQAVTGDRRDVQRLNAYRSRIGQVADRPHAILALTETFAGRIVQSTMRVDNPSDEHAWARLEHPVQELCCCSGWTRGERQNHDVAHRATCDRIGYFPAIYGILKKGWN